MNRSSIVGGMLLAVSSIAGGWQYYHSDTVKTAAVPEAISNDSLTNPAILDLSREPVRQADRLPRTPAESIDDLVKQILPAPIHDSHTAHRVIITDRVRGWTSLDEASDTAVAAGFYFLIRNKVVAGAEFLQISVGGNPVWVQAGETAAAWNSIGIRPERLHASLSVYTTSDSCVDSVVHGLSMQTPLARLSTGSLVTPLPLLEERSVSDGRAVLQQVVASKPVIQNSVSEANSVLQSDADIVLVIDNTYGTDRLRDAGLELLQRLQNGQRGFGAVLYRDYAPGLFFDTNEAVSLLMQGGKLRTDASQLQIALAAVKAPEVTSIDWAEAMLDGLYAAIQHVSWRQPAHQRIVVLLSNAPGHLLQGERNPYRLSVASIAKLARKKGVCIIAVHSDGGGGDEVQLTQRRMHEELAIETGGLSLPFNQIHGLPELLSNPTNWATANQSQQTNLDSELTRGWIAAGEGEAALTEKSVLLTRKQVNALQVELIALLANLRFESAAGVSSLFDRQPHKLTFSEMLRKCGIPLTDSRFELTQLRLVQMPVDDRRRLAEHIESVVLPGVQAAEHIVPSTEHVWIALNLL